MTETFSPEQVKAYLAQVNQDIEKGRIDPMALKNDFSFHQARIQAFEFDIHAERIQMEVACVDWLKENTGSPNPYLPQVLLFHDVVQLYYKNREARKEVRIFDLQALTISDLLIESKELYTHRADSGRPIALDVQMPLDDTELIILCSQFEIHVDGRVVMVRT
ncbi:MAG: hypothetical protein R3231_02470 [bacterium]|nr:hypothetical protein [bacterium]